LGRRRITTAREFHLDVIVELAQAFQIVASYCPQPDLVAGEHTASSYLFKLP
jgi:hypothetical protein